VSALVAVPPERVGVVLAAGGERLVAWYTGVLAGLADEGLDLRRSPAVVGTSAGALVAARLAAGADPRDAAGRLAGRRPRPAAPPHAPAPAAQLFAQLARTLAETPGSEAERRRAIGRLAVERSPGGAEEHVARMRERLPAGPWPAALRVVALDAGTGERVVFDRTSGAPLDRVVAAARSVPLLLAPVSIGGRVCVDGAIASSTSADVLARDGAVELALVVTGSPAEAAPDSVDGLWNAALAEELRALEAAGIGTLLVRATAAERAAMGPDPMSRATAHRAVAAGRRRGRELVRPRRAAHGREDAAVEAGVRAAITPPRARPAQKMSGGYS